MEYFCGFFGSPTTESEVIVDNTDSKRDPNTERQFTTFDERMNSLDFGAEMEDNMKLPVFLLKSEQDRFPSHCNKLCINTFLIAVNQPQEVDNNILGIRGILPPQNETVVRDDQNFQWDHRQQAERFDLIPLDQRRSTPLEARRANLLNEERIFNISEPSNSNLINKCKDLWEIDYELLGSNISSDYFIFCPVKNQRTLAKPNMRKRKQHAGVTGNTSQQEERLFYSKPRARNNAGGSNTQFENIDDQPQCKSNGEKVQLKVDCTFMKPPCLEKTK